jgi:hypothetical protein
VLGVTWLVGTLSIGLAKCGFAVGKVSRCFADKREGDRDSLGYADVFLYLKFKTQAPDFALKNPLGKLYGAERRNYGKKNCLRR